MDSRPIEPVYRGKQRLWKHPAGKGQDRGIGDHRRVRNVYSACGELFYYAINGNSRRWLCLDCGTRAG